MQKRGTSAGAIERKIIIVTIINLGTAPPPALVETGEIPGGYPGAVGSRFVVVVHIRYMSARADSYK